MTAPLRVDALVQPTNTVLVRFESSALPSDVSGYPAVSEGDAGGVGVRADGRLDLWGSVAWQEPAARITNAIDVSVGGTGFIVLLANGRTARVGEAGFITEMVTDQTVPFPVYATNLVAVSAGKEHSLALSATGDVFGGGSDYYYESTPPPMATNILQVAAGFFFSAALRTDGRIVYWSSNYRGLLADATHIRQIATDHHNIYGLQEDGQIFIAGSTAPADHIWHGASNIIAVAASPGRCLALGADLKIHTVALGVVVTTASPNPLVLPNVVQLYAQGYCTGAYLDGPFLVRATGEPEAEALDFPVGANITLRAVFPANPGGPIQWFRDDVPVPGAAGTTLELLGAQAEMSGHYSVSILRPDGRRTSQSVEVAIGRPRFVTEPGNLTVAERSPGKLKFEVHSADPVTYEWLVDGRPIADWNADTHAFAEDQLPANQPVFVLPPASLAMSGAYEVVAHNASGSARSRAAIVTVVPTPWPDVEISSPDSVYNLFGAASEVAQTFVAGISGRLDHVQLLPCNYDDQYRGTLIFEVTPTDPVTGAPSGAALGRALLRDAGCVYTSIYFDETPVFVQTGQAYALVIREDSSSQGAAFSVHTSKAAGYLHGKLWARQASDAPWLPAIQPVLQSEVDLLLTTHVFPGIPLVWITRPPGGTHAEVGRPTTLEAAIDPGQPGQARVVFRVAGREIGAATSSPFKLEWTPDVVGEFEVVAEAQSAEGVAVRSAPRTVRVFSGQPSNDDFSAARLLAGDNPRDSFTLEGATLELFEEPANPGSSGRTVWWTWQAPYSGRVTMGIQPTSPDWSLGIHAGSAAETADVLSSAWGSMSFPVVGGTTYHLSVDTRNGSSPTTGTLMLAINDVELTTPRPDTRFTGPVDIPISAERAGPGTRQISSVRLLLDDQIVNTLGAPPYGTTLVNPSFGRHELRAVSADDSGFETLSRPVTIFIQPPNDRFSNAQVVTGANIAIHTSNGAATTESGPKSEPHYGDNQGGHSIWYRWTAPRDGLVIYHGEGLPQGVLVGIYIGNTAGNLAEVASNAFARPDGYYFFNAKGGQTYQIMVDGLLGEEGSLDWTLELVTNNALFLRRTRIPGTHFAEIFPLEGGILEPGEERLIPPGAQASRWWSWQAPHAGLARLHVGVDGGAVGLGVFEGTWIKGLVPVAASTLIPGGAEVSWMTEAGHSYEIAVFTGAPTTGTGRLELDFGTIRILNPTPGAVAGVHLPITLEARMDVNGATLAAVEFSANRETIASLASPPYLHTWSPGASGNYILRAVARTLSGQTFESEPVRMLVIQGEEVPKPRLFTDPEYLGTFLIDAAGSLRLLGNSVNAFGIPPPAQASVPQFAEWPPGVRRWSGVVASGPAFAPNNPGNTVLYALSEDGVIYVNGETPAAPPPGVNRFTRLISSSGPPLAVADDGRIFANGDELPSGHHWVDAGFCSTGLMTLADDDQLFVHDRGMRGEPLSHLVPKPTGAGRWVRMNAGSVHFMLIDDHREIYVLGNTYWGSTSVPTAPPFLVPRPPGVSGWRDFHMANYHALALSDDGQLYAWGRNNEGQLGTGPDPNPAVQWQKVINPPGVTAWITFTGGYMHSMAVGNDCSLYAWGSNFYGELGIPESPPLFEPTRVPGIDGICGEPLLFSRGASSRLADGTFKLAFPTLLNRQYIVQYSDDLSVWKTAFPNLTGTGEFLEWIDRGAPFTDMSPANLSSRWYRVLLGP